MKRKTARRVVVKGARNRRSSRSLGSVFSARPKRLLSESWYKILPGPRSEFSRFIGLSIPKLETATWDDLADQMQSRFGMVPLGGGMRFQGSPIEEFTFKFQLPRRDLKWTVGLNGGWAYIDGAREHLRWAQGHGKTLHHAAMNAILSLWELTYLRATQVTRRKPNS